MGDDDYQPQRVVRHPSHHRAPPNDRANLGAVHSHATSGRVIRRTDASQDAYADLATARGTCFRRRWCEPPAQSSGGHLDQIGKFGHFVKDEGEGPQEAGFSHPRTVLMSLVLVPTSASRIPHIDFHSLDCFAGMCTDGKSIRQDTSLNSRASL
jgi:hypothetical protein